MDTDRDGIGWGEFLRVKIMIDLYKPLSRGRMMKFDGKSTLIGFKYVRLPKYCYHCGVICHGVEGCLKWSMLRNQETIQFGPWLRATSPTRRSEKTYERLVGNADSSRLSPSALERGTRRDDHQGRKGHGRKRKPTNSGEDDYGEGIFRGRLYPQTKNGMNGCSSTNHGDNNVTSHVDPQQEKEGGYVGIKKDRFEKQSTTINEAWTSSKDGKNLVGIKASAQGEHSPFRKSKLSPAGTWSVGYASDSENLSQPAMGLGLGGNFASPGGLFPGPILADIVESIKEAKTVKIKAKRKDREDVFDQNGDPISRRKKRELGGDETTSGYVLPTFSRSDGADYFDDSGVAEAGVQPR